MARGSSPHTRGARLRRQRGDPGIGIIPAYAGSTCPDGGFACCRGDHPRIRGEHSRLPDGARRRRGSSPHTRGAPVPNIPSLKPGGIIPAYAGSTAARRCSWLCSRDHPRIRGEHAAVLLASSVCAGSSPHTRGARARRRRSRLLLRIIPAYAGSTGPGVFDPPRGRDHPRIRGEHIGQWFGPRAYGGSSPHTRGALPRHLRSRLASGIIPAYAGSTCRSLGRSSRWSDHPRIRGEHMLLPIVTKITGGSSPHTRGALLEIPAIPRIAAVIIPVFLYPSPTPQEEADRSMVLLTLS